MQAEKMIQGLKAEMARLNKRLERRQETAPGPGFQAAALAMPDPVFVHQDGRMVFLNPPARLLFGAREDAEILGQPIGRFIAPEADGLVGERIQALLDQSTPTPPLFQEILRLDGSRETVETTAARIDWRGQPAVMVWARRAAGKTSVERELAMSQAVINQAFKISPDKILIALKRDGRVIMASEGLAAMLGLTSRQLIGTSGLIRRLWVNQGRCDEFLARLNLEGAVVDFEAEFQDQKGRIRTYALSGRVFEAGGEECLITIRRDITEAKRAARYLEDQERQLRSLVENSPDVIMRFDPDLRHLFANRQAGAVWPPYRGEFTGKTHRQLGFDEEYCAIWEQGLTQAFQTGQSRETSFEFDSPQGSFIFNWRLVPEPDPEGQVKTVLSIARDITQHRRLERDYAALFSQMLDGFAIHELITDPEGQPLDYRFLSANPAFERLTGLKAADIEGRTVLEVLPGTERHWIETYAQVVKTGQPLRFEQYSGELEKHFEVVAFKTRANQFATAFQDVTPRKQAEEENKKLQAQLLQAQKLQAVGTLAGGIAHDFNNILSAIMGYAELMELDLAEGEDPRPSLDQILAAARRAKELINQILIFSRNEEHEKRPVDIGQVVEEGLRMLRATIPSTIQVEKSIAPDGLTALADPTQVHQVLLNLCTNAAHALNAGPGTLRVGVASRELTPNEPDPRLQGLAPGPYVELTVADDGCGIAPEIMDRIWEPYFTTKDQGVGTGLGLAAAHGIVMAHQGAIHAESLPGQGTVFTVLLPAVDREPCPVKLTPLPAPGHKANILFVDDEEMLVELARQTLTRLGYQVQGFTDPLQALEAFGQNPQAFDLVITDQTMPGLAGDALARRLLALRPGLPIILCTGYSGVIDRQQTREIGIAALVMKPLVMSELGRTIEEALTG